jgi:Domain of unknown function (DUF6851)/VCPO second helical-bundle domain
VAHRSAVRWLVGILVATVATVGAAQTSASAAKTPPPPPKPAKPIGKSSTLPFDQYGPSATDDVVLHWDEETLTAVRATKPAPTVVARALAVVHTAIYDAWAPYDAVAVGTRLGGSLRRPADERTAAYKSKAISYAAYRALVDLFPSRAADFTTFLTTLGYDPADASTDTTTPEGIGNVTAQAVLDFRHADGANQLGDAPGAPAGRAYADYTGYTPVNTWNRLVDPYHWQPQCVPMPPPGATSCAGAVQSFATPQWNRVTPFALSRPDQFGPPAMNRANLPAEAKQLVDYQAKLTDAIRTSAYYWADGPSSELPPGHWAMFAQAAARAYALDLDSNVKGFFALGNALLDASIASWNAKTTQDTVRPISYVRWLYAGQEIKGWAGPGKGIVTEDGSAWQPYQEASVVTPPFAEYTSGHSAFSAAASQVFTRLLGTDKFKVELTVTVRRGVSTIEPGIVPAKDTVLKFASFSDAADQAGMSRRYGGIHFEDGDLAGRTLGKAVGNAAWDKARTYITGTAT